jgi:hypothetical protein
MPTKPIPNDEILRRFKALKKAGGNISAAAKAVGVKRSTIRNMIKRYKPPADDALEFPEFPPEYLPIDRLIDRLKEQSSIKKASFDAHTWFPVKVKDDLPIGIMWFGDPHVDDNGCDWNLLSRHVELCHQPGVYGVNIGDTTNNWFGRLASKYANQDTSVSTARRLAAWFMLESGVKWLLTLVGNHDGWGDGAAILAEMAKRHGTQKVVLHDWEARFSLNFSNGTVINVWAAHDFPGDSQWNPLHGPVKAARFGPDVDLLVCGHKHNWGISQWELADKGTSPVMIRTRGYKFNDDYARRIGKQDQKAGSSIFTVIDPNGPTRESRIIPFVDVERGVEYLQWLREKYVISPQKKRTKRAA